MSGDTDKGAEGAKRPPDTGRAVNGLVGSSWGHIFFDEAHFAPPPADKSALTFGVPKVMSHEDDQWRCIVRRALGIPQQSSVASADAPVSSAKVAPVDAVIDANFIKHVGQMAEEIRSLRAANARVENLLLRERLRAATTEAELKRHASARVEAAVPAFCADLRVRYQHEDSLPPSDVGQSSVDVITAAAKAGFDVWADAFREADAKTDTFMYLHDEHQMTSADAEPVLRADDALTVVSTAISAALRAGNSQAEIKIVIRQMFRCAESADVVAEASKRALFLESLDSGKYPRTETKEVGVNEPWPGL